MFTTCALFIKGKLKYCTIRLVVYFVNAYVVNTLIPEYPLNYILIEDGHLVSPGVCLEHHDY